MLNLNPPQHAPDDPPTWISPSDTAWDTERIKAEKATLGEEAADQHPVEIYYSGATRFSLKAEIVAPEQIGGPVKITDYIIGKPTRFEIRRLDARGSRRMSGLIIKEQKTDIATGEWQFVAIKRGVVAVRNPDMELKRDDDGHLGQGFVDMLDQQGGLVLSLASAISSLTFRATEAAEGKP